MRKTKDKTESNGAEWQAEIPKKAVTKIAFYRLTKQNGSTQATIYNAWHTRSNLSSMVNPSIAQNHPDWYRTNTFDLQETRRFLDTSTNTYDNSLVYTAVHGNGYEITTTPSERLSPCIGYWSYDPGSGSSSTGGGGQTGGGGSSSTTCSTTVILRVPNDLSGKEAVVIGRSNIVGKPMAMLLLQQNCTVTMCHSRTRDLAEHTRRADILVAAVGKAGFVTADMVKPGAVVIDVGINRVDGKVCGDVDFETVKEVAGWITPVPGGVGRMTIAMLLANTADAAERTMTRE